MEHVHVICGLEIALHKGRPDDAMPLLAQLRNAAEGKSFRIKAHHMSVETRVAQMDSTYQCAEETIRELGDLLELAIPLSCADGLIVALGEALRRRGRTDEARRVIDKFLTYRRDRTPIPSEVLRLARACDFGLAGR